MSESLPERVDVQRLAQQNARLAGPLPFAEMPRLQNVLRRKEGAASLEARFSIDEMQRVNVAGRITAAPYVTCQRCLREMPLPLDAAFSLVAVASDDEAARLPEQYEPLLLTAGILVLAELVTDELLLALPMMPKHARREDCGAIVTDYVEQAKPEPAARKNPFAVLAELKSDHSED